MRVDLLAVVAPAQKEIVRYQRGDGLDLNATLYLPPGYERERDGRLACLLWAYPREYKSRVRARRPCQALSHQMLGRRCRAVQGEGWADGGPLLVSQGCMALIACPACMRMAAAGILHVATVPAYDTLSASTRCHRLQRARHIPGPRVHHSFTEMLKLS